MIRTALILSLSICFAASGLAADAPVKKPVKKTTEAEVAGNTTQDDAAITDFEFKRDPQRRDPFYSVLDVVETKLEIQEFLEEQNSESTAKTENNQVEQLVITQTDNKVKVALAKARYQSKRASLSLLDGSWKAAITASDEGLQILQAASTLEGADQFAKEINSVIVQLNGFKTTAKDAQLNEEAENKFNALQLEVQGIMWSADKRSLAIISGEAFFVQDRIGDDDDAVTIVNIDPNRVDFMINHKRKRFEFKRYINN